MRGRFITFEGGEGSGKSTQARLLAAHLRTMGAEVVETREPGGSPFAERVRNLILDPTIPPHGALAEALLFYSARSDHIDAVVAPALAAGGIVICDRFSDSTRVYQGLVGGLPDATLQQLETLVVGACRPDLTFLLDLDAAAGLERARQRRLTGTDPHAASDAFEARELAYHQRLRAGFLELARREPGRIAVLDATQDVETLARQVRDETARRLGDA
ncbi:MAG: dTMP kinase [Hyphomicrobiaceae bacterium]